MARSLMRRALLVALLAAPSVAMAAEPQAFKVRLAVMPIMVATQSTIAGEGQARARLQGARLTIEGEFRGLKSRATTGEVRSAAPGLRGPEIFKLTVSPEGDQLSGKIGGTFDLSPQQAADLRAGKLYLQLSSEKAAEGNLRGWLEPVEQGR